jgi:hypothetical protein
MQNKVTASFRLLDNPANGSVLKVLQKGRGSW